ERLRMPSRLLLDIEEPPFALDAVDRRDERRVARRLRIERRDGSAEGARRRAAVDAAIAVRVLGRQDGVTRYASKTASIWRSAFSSERRSFTSPTSAVYQFLASWSSVEPP